MNTPSQTQILEAEERLRQAMYHNDVSVLDELIAPDLLFTGINGQLASKADDLAAHRARLLRLTTIEPVEQTIQLRPGFAVVSALMHLAGTYEGTPMDQYLRYTRVWVLAGDGSVQITAGHMSEVKS
jgi:ketosteroid isomerase-like protein